VLPAVTIARAGEELAIDVIVDRAAAGNLFAATLMLENGETVALRFRPSEGTPVAARRISGALRERWRVRTGHLVPPGLHRLESDGSNGLVIATPGRTWQPAEILDRKCWGSAVNLHATRSERDWGIGDFSTLAEIVAETARRGGALVGINPLHALFPDRSDHISPYYPSDRRFLEPAYIDPASMPEYRDLAGSDPWFAGAEAAAAVLRAAPLIDYAAVFKLKSQAFRKIWAHFRQRHAGADDSLAGEFRRFVTEGGDQLQKFVRFESGRESDADEVQYRLFLQWWADRSLALAADQGLGIGLYRDLAVGPAPYGAEVRLSSDAFASGISVGAPPDPYSDVGQVWGIPPFNPRALRHLQYRPWIDLVRANMRHAGALRLDHVMGLERLLWTPEGSTAADGAYVRNDAEALLAILAVESHRRRCIVIGEDLGTVPSGFRERMAAAGLFSMSVMLFERDGAGFKPPAEYRAQSIASFGTHDLSPLSGWWRDHRRDAQGAAFAATVGAAAGAVLSADTEPAALSVAVHAALGRSGAEVALAQFDDLAGEEMPVNVPGTTSEHPNWRRRTAASVRDVFDSAPVAGAIDAIGKGRR
jgi:4-alpha-glucanotransferase